MIAVANTMIAQTLTMTIRTQFTILRSMGRSFRAFDTGWHPAPGQIQPDYIGRPGLLPPTPPLLDLWNMRRLVIDNS